MSALVKGMYYNFVWKTFNFRHLVFELVCDYIFQREELNQNKFFNQNDKKLINRCCDLFHHIFLLETGKELHPSDEYLNSRLVKMDIDALAGRIIDVHKVVNEWRLGKKKLDLQGLI